MQHHRFGCNRWCYCDHNSKLLQYVKNITTNKCCVANILNFVAVGWCYCNHFEILLQYLGNNAMISLSCNRLDCRCNSKVLLPLLTKWLRLLLTIAINIICCYTVLFGCRRLVYIATKKNKTVAITRPYCNKYNSLVLYSIWLQKVGIYCNAHHNGGYFISNIAMNF